MRVRERHHVQPLDAARPQIGRHDFLAHVDARAISAHPLRAGQSAAVDQHRAAVGKRDEDRVALADVENVHFELSVVERWSERMRDNQ